MTDPTPELEEGIRMAFLATEPARVFRGCKIAYEGARVIVRVYSHRAGWEKLMPTPYQIFRFDAELRVLSAASEEESARYTIQNYK